MCVRVHVRTYAHVRAYLLGQAATSPRSFIVHDHFGKGDGATGAIRSGDLKLIVGRQPMSTWFGAFSPNGSSAVGAACGTMACGERPCLFNISADPTEHVDLVHRREWLRDLSAPAFPRRDRIDSPR